ncbi:MAG: amidohydrolase [Candidatus Muiribacteriaceae bacterium]
MSKKIIQGNIFSPEKKYDWILVEDGIIKKAGNGNIPKVEADSVDLKDYFIYPAFHDSHVHIELFARSLKELRFNEHIDVPQLLFLLSEECGRCDGSILTGGGFGRTFLDHYPGLAEIDKATGNTPVILYSKDIHTFVLNSAMFDILSDDHKQKFAGYIQKDEMGYTGLVFEKGAELVGDFIKPDRNDLENMLKEVPKAFWKYGVTSVHNMDGGNVIQIMEDGVFPSGLRVISYVRDQSQLKSVNVRGKKIFADGSLGSLTAWMIDPYSGKKSCGIGLYSESELEEMIRICADLNIPPAVHAIGDRANHILINLYKKYGGRHWRIEHAQTIRDEDIGKCRDIIFSMQPSHIFTDIELAEKNIDGYQRYMFRFRSILDNGGKLIFGSDTPVDRPDPLRGIYMASERIDIRDDSVWQGQERLTRLEAIKAYTVWPGEIEDNMTGRIEPGYKADLVVLDKDIMVCPFEDIMKAEVFATYFAGECVFGTGAIESQQSVPGIDS